MTTDVDTPLTDDISLGDARKWLRECVDDGAKCPVCTQFAKVYRRKVNSSMAYGLIVMYRVHGLQWGHAPSTEHVARLGGELARLRLWGLVQEQTAVRDDGGRAGWWRVTMKGEQFIRNEILIPKYVRIYDGRVLSRDTDQMVSIIDALGTRFDYRELMAGP